MLSLVGLFVSSCLNLEPKANMGDDLVWNSADNFQLFANNFYSWSRDFELNKDFTYGNGLSDGPHSDFRSDLIAASQQNQYSQGTNTIPAEDKNYKELYKRIYYTNLLLDRANSFSDKEAIKVPVAEAKFFRAYLYFELVQIYGDAILVTRPLDLDSEELRRERDNRSVVIDQIITDLQEAAMDLPPKASETGRLTSYAANAMISRVALYEGTWQKFHTNGAETTTNTERSTYLLGLAKDAALLVMDGTYELFRNETLGDESYRYMFILEDETCNPAGVTKSANTEYIFSHRHRSGDALSINISHAMFCNAAWMTRKLADMYLCSNGLPIDNPASSTLFKGYSTASSEFENRDSRMDATFVVQGKKYFNNDEKWRTSWNDDDFNNALTADASRICKGSGYQSRKWVVERQVADYYESMDYPVIRYAEVLLNYAEAMYELNGTISDTDLGISLNLVRKRSNPKMPELNESLVTTYGLNMREEIRRERTVELLLEGFRIDDLKRWATAKTEMPQTQYGIHYTGTWFETNWRPMTLTIGEDGCVILYSGRQWADKNYLYPLPADQRQLNPNLGQNPGWDD